LGADADLVWALAMGSFAEPAGDAFKPDSRPIEGRLGRGIGDESAPA